MIENKAKTGELIYAGEHRHGLQAYSWWRCVDCGYEYPDVKGRGYPTCNQVVISKCPWCRPDSKPWFAGRGL